MKKFILLLAVLGLSVCTQAQVTTIDSGTCGNNLTWVLISNGTLTISGIGDMTVFDYFNTSPWYNNPYQNAITAVVIGDSVTSIGDGSFGYCFNLKSVIIGNSVTRIGNWAFSYCNSLISIIIPNNVAFIEDWAFDCFSLTSLTSLAKTPPLLLGSNVFYSLPTNTPVYIPCGTTTDYQRDWNYFSNFIEIQDTTFVFDTACFGTIYNSNGFNVPAVADIYYRTDSCHTICLTLREYPNVPITSYSDTLCYGEIYNDSNFTNLTQSGTYYDTLQNVNGCDSIVCLSLFIDTIVIISYSDTICQGDVYNGHSFSNLTSSGIYYDTLQSINGCDSIIELTLIVNPTSFTPISDSIYIGNSYDFHGKLLTEGGIYYDTLQTIHGCDSIVELTLTVIGVGIVETHCNASLRVYPNPANGQLTIEYGSSACFGYAQQPTLTAQERPLSEAEVEIYNVVGQLMQKAPFNSPEGGKYSPPSEGLGEATITMDISHLANGMYFLKIGNQTARFVQKNQKKIT